MIMIMIQTKISHNPENVRKNEDLLILIFQAQKPMEEAKGKESKHNISHFCKPSLNIWKNRKNMNSYFKLGIEKLEGKLPC